MTATAFVHISSDLKHHLNHWFSAFNVTIWCLITLHHLISIKKSYTCQLIKKSQSVYLSFALLFFSGVAQLCLFSLAYDVNSVDWICYISQFSGFTCYVVFKSILYLMLVQRLHDGFKNSILQYNDQYLLLWIVFLVLWNSVNLCLGYTFIDIHLDLNVHPICVIDFPQWIPASMTMVDWTSSVINSYLFCSPIHQLRKLFRSSSMDTDTKELQYVAVKQCILSIIACVTTAVAMVSMAIFNLGPVFVATDLNISAFSVLLMYTWNGNLFQRLCGWCIQIPTSDELKLEYCIENQVPKVSVDVLKSDKLDVVKMTNINK